MAEDRKPFGGLTPDEVDSIAEKAAEKAINKVYQEIGKSVAKKILWFVGAASLALLAWLAGTGKVG